MVWTRIKKIVIVLTAILGAKQGFAQESLWKTFNDNDRQEVPAYNGGFSPFPQKQKEVEEVNFQPVENITELDLIEKDGALSDEEKRMMMTTKILSELKEYLETEEVFLPSLDGIVVEGVAKSKGKFKALIFGRWLEQGDSIKVPINEAQKALDLLENLKEIDDTLADTVEDAVIERTKGKGQEIVKIFDIKEDRVVLETRAGDAHTINFIKTPF